MYAKGFSIQILNGQLNSAHLSENSLFILTVFAFKESAVAAYESNLFHFPSKNSKGMRPTKPENSYEIP